MVTALTTMAVFCTVPAALAQDDRLAVLLGFNALVWSALAVGANLAGA